MREVSIFIDIMPCTTAKIDVILASELGLSEEAKLSSGLQTFCIVVLVIISSSINSSLQWDTLYENPLPHSTTGSCVQRYLTKPY